MDADHAAAAVARSTRTNVLVLHAGAPVTLTQQAADPSEALQAIAQAAGLQHLLATTSRGEIHILARAGTPPPPPEDKERPTTSLELIGAAPAAIEERLRRVDPKVRVPGSQGELTAVLYDQPAREVAELLRALPPPDGPRAIPPLRCKEKVPQVSASCASIDELGLVGLVDGSRPVAILTNKGAAALAEEGDALARPVLVADEARRWHLALGGERPAILLGTEQSRALALGSGRPSLCERNEETRLLCTLDDGQSLAWCTGKTGHTVRIGLASNERATWYAPLDSDGSLMRIELLDEAAEIQVRGHANQALIRGRRLPEGGSAWSLQDNQGTQACREVAVDPLRP